MLKMFFQLVEPDFNNSLGRTVEILEQLDPLMNQDGVWLDVKHYVATVTAIAEIINQQLELLAGEYMKCLSEKKEKKVLFFL